MDGLAEGLDEEARLVEVIYGLQIVSRAQPLSF